MVQRIPIPLNENPGKTWARESIAKIGEGDRANFWIPDLNAIRFLKSYRGPEKHFGFYAIILGAIQYLCTQFIQRSSLADLHCFF